MQGAHVPFLLVSSLSLSRACTHRSVCCVNCKFLYMFTPAHAHSFLSCALDCCVNCKYCPYIDLVFYFAVPPAYYAHLAAFRARFYMEPETSDSGSMTSGAAAGRGGMGGAGPRSTRPPGANATVRPLPALKENVKRVMFYC
jgi:hypothetical protein